ncbi:hypothetical protein PY254_16940 [Rhodanobacter sp. AS-Z3]|uniref:hypothetical protein n=1 Tax=Rhodanobacter sp. AS-Z3 TaxID=3031330 RepID=UPI0024786281|nr:hypothetical protein [Rhodanobacter sp. AS-Z3]WEN14895.1 hypothetical protein PY254_16940 [Rhodanobacter sp. AS-Z3]
MPFLRILRHQQQRHGAVMRWAMAWVLLSVIAAGMPRWIVHAHTAEHAALSVVAFDAHTLDIQDSDASDATEPTPGSTHLHGHFIGTFSSLLPSALMSVAVNVLRSQRCPPGQISSPCEVHLATLHRPPIA